MCEKCVRKFKRLGLKGVTYGQIKAIAQSVLRPPWIRGLFCNCNDIAVEAHLYKIHQAKTNKKKYNRKKFKKDV